MRKTKAENIKQMKKIDCKKFGDRDDEHTITVKDRHTSFQRWNMEKLHLSKSSEVYRLLKKATKAEFDNMRATNRGIYEQ